MTQRRPFWRAIEAVHDVVYVAPHATSRYEALGLRGYQMGYVASRSAAIGTPGPSTVTALFHGFAPAIVHRALPDAWRLAARDEVLAARLDLITRGWVDAAGALTDIGRAARTQIEDTTDRVCAAGLDREATGRAITVEDSVVALARRIEQIGAVTYPNPTGVPRP